MAYLEVRQKYYIIIFSNSNRNPKRKSFIFKKADYTKRRVTEIMHELEARFKTGLWDPWLEQPVISKDAEPVRLDEAIAQYIEKKSAEDWRNVTAQNNILVLKSFSDSLPGLTCNNLTPDHINDFVNRPALAYETKKSYMRVVKTLVNWLLKKNYFDKFDKDALKIFSRGQNRDTINYLSPAEQKHLESYIVKKVRQDIRSGFQDHGRNALWLIDFIRWQRMSGMRISETLSLTPASINKITWDVTIGSDTFSTKTGSKQILPVGQVSPLVKILKKKLRGCKSDTDLLFGMSDRRYVSKMFRKYKNEALPGRKDIHVHSLRHSCCIDLLKAGVDVYRVKRWMRHTNIQTTMHYADMLGIDLSSKIGEVFK